MELTRNNVFKILLALSAIGFVSGYTFSTLTRKWNEEHEDDVEENVDDEATTNQPQSDKESDGSNPFLSSPNPKHSDDEDNESIGFAPPEFQPVKIHYDYWDPENKKQIRPSQ